MRVIVIGGGVVGLSIALSLQAQTHEVVLVEAEEEGRSASYGNAGHLAIEQVEPLASMEMVYSAPKRWFMRGGALSLPPQGFAQWAPFLLKLLPAARPERFEQGKAALKALMIEAMPAWKRRVRDLGMEDLLRENGHFVVWETPESARAGLAAWRAKDTGTARWLPVTDSEMAQVSSLVQKKIHGAIRFENTGQIADTACLLEVMRDRFHARGGTVRYDRTGAVSVEGTSAFARTGSGDSLTGEAVIIAAGIGSRPLMEGLGYRVPLIAERGYHIQSTGHGWPEGFPPVVFEDRSLIVTGFESGLRVAGFVELNRADALPDPRKWRKLRQHAAALGLPLDMQTQEWMGARPTLPDYLPAIGKSDRADNLYYAFGHQHLGLTLGAVTGEMVAGMLQGQPVPSAFSINRFH